MDPFLATLYGTSQALEAEKVAAAEPVEYDPAQVEAFTKVAAAHGIDLTKLSEAQVEELWDATFSKVAEFGEKDESKEHEKKESPKKEKAEHSGSEDDKEEAEKKAYAEWFEAHDQAGRIMAHAFHQESQKIASAADKLKNFGSHIAEQVGKAGKSVGDAAKSVKDKVHGVAKHPHMAAAEAGEKVRDAAKQHGSHAAVGVGGAALGVGGAAAAHHFGKKKEASDESAIRNLNDAAIDSALEKVAAAGWDVDQAVERLGAVFTLAGIDGPSDLSKVAACDSAELAVDTRALQLLEAAGYPVEWAV